MIREELEKIAEQYLDDNGSCTSSRYEDKDDEDEEEILIREEMAEFLDGTNVKYKLEIVSGFDSGWHPPNRNNGGRKMHQINYTDMII